MSGVASKLSRLPRTRSLSGLQGQNSSCSILAHNSPHRRQSPGLSRCCSVRGLHGSILNPRAPKIRHLNAAHSLLLDLDKHIAKVQELENTVYELEQQLRERADKQNQAVVSDPEPRKLEPLPDITNSRLKRCLVTDEERIKFQNRLADARLKAEELSRKTTEEEANILRSWHSKKLKCVLDNLNNNLMAAAESPKLLPAPSQVEEDNRIFSCLNALVDIANEQEVEETSGVEKLMNLIIERENLKQFLTTVRSKLDDALRAEAECARALRTIEQNRTALHLEIQTSTTLLSSLLRHKRSNDIWIFGPNPIFAGLREIETTASYQGFFVMEMLKKLDISRIHTQHHQALARNLVEKYTRRLNLLNARVECNEAAIDEQVEAIGCERLEAVEAAPRPASPKGQLVVNLEAKDVENPR